MDVTRDDVGFDARKKASDAGEIQSPVCEMSTIDCLRTMAIAVHRFRPGLVAMSWSWQRSGLACERWCRCIIIALASIGPSRA